MGQWLVIAASVCAAWIFWSESRDRGWIPGLAPPADAVNQHRPSDAVPAVELPSVSQLLAELSNPIDPVTRREALLTLSSIGPAASEAIGPIRERLKDEDAGVRYAAVIALWRVSRDAELALSELPALMEDPSVNVRSEATAAMIAIGRPATAPAIQILHSESPAARNGALLVLRRIVCPETFPEVSEAIESLCQDPDSNVRTEALVACVDWGIHELAAIRQLLRTDQTVSAEHSNIRNRNSREVALQAIAWLGPEAAALVPDLVSLLEECPEWEGISLRSEDESQANSRTFQIRTLVPYVQSTLRALSSLKSVARPAVPQLIGRLSKLDVHSRTPVIETLVEIGAEPELVKPEIGDLVVGTSYHAAQRVGRLLAWADPTEARRQAAELIQ